MDSLLYLLESLLETIEEQIEAAKKLDTEALGRATERRQDLLFEIEVEQEGRVMEADDELFEIKKLIDIADERLLNILETVVHITKEVEGLDAFYSKKGNLKES
jgi:hypothetical protein